MSTISTEVRKFDLYRYQLLPLTQHVQVDWMREHQSLDSLRRNKNAIFASVLKAMPQIQHRGNAVIHRLGMQADDWFVFHIAPKKTLARYKPDFDVEHLDDWPHVILVINNSSDVQGIAVSRNQKAFTSTSVVIKMLTAHLQGLLGAYQLHIEIEALFEKTTFWSLVDKYAGKITSVVFELVSPNMANISKTLEVDLHRLNAETNSHRTDLRLNSGDGSALEIKRSNTVVDSLVDYASAGGGDIVLRVRGVRSRIRTSKNVRDVSIDEITLKNPTPDSLAIFRDLFK